MSFSVILGTGNPEAQDRTRGLEVFQELDQAAFDETILRTRERLLSEGLRPQVQRPLGIMVANTAMLMELRRASNNTRFIKPWDSITFFNNLFRDQRTEPAVVYHPKPFSAPNQLGNPQGTHSVGLMLEGDVLNSETTGLHNMLKKYNIRLLQALGQVTIFPEVAQGNANAVVEALGAAIPDEGLNLRLGNINTRWVALPLGI